MSFDHKGLGSEARRTYAKLVAMVATHEALIRADPVPHLNKAGEIIAKQQQLIHELYDALHGADLIFDTAIELKVEPTNINGEAYIRNQKATELLANYFK